ncbi:alpha/beta hydrolase [Ramlibacter sp. USB13]|uniref:Alpha/beta hydrolase n=1 Tax=Ramlibacter cellulosilyticus TaxID=2764187 RepID=A0A923SE35_9BURK|nr:alpha/beta hydrolase [Ramlibacter cellulosilyticus]MBC5782547.1 alpha/beta hydrolase [Ramlibacter cellulosilyticus]
MDSSSSSAVQATAGYYQASVGLRFFRFALGTSQKLWPALATRAAVRLFCTPLPPKWLQRRAAWAADWKVAQWPFEDAQLTVYTQAAQPHGPVALLVHGWGGHARQLLPLAESLAQHGLRPVLLEMPAHGRSAGSTSNLPQFARAIDYAVGRLQQEGHEIGLLAAHSLGANAAAYAASRGIGIGKLVLLAPPASPRNYTRYFAQVFGLSETTRAAMQKHIEAREGVLMQHFEPRAVAPRIRVPTLVVHDRGDAINAFTDGQAFAQAIQGAQLLPTEGLGHRKLLKDPAVVAKVVLFAR